MRNVIEHSAGGGKDWKTLLGNVIERINRDPGVNVDHAIYISIPQSVSWHKERMGKVNGSSFANAEPERIMLEGFSSSTGGPQFGVFAKMLYRPQRSFNESFVIGEDRHARLVDSNGQAMYRPCDFDAPEQP